MPMPGSQQHDTLDIAYFLHSYRWLIRIALVVLMLMGARRAFSGKRKWIPAAAAAFLMVAIYIFNFQMMADSMFKEPTQLVFRDRESNVLTDSSLIIGVVQNGVAKAYPIRYLSYHHQVRDTVGGKSVMVTYCNVCRTGRVFEPFVQGRAETFRLVGMDHFNAMFEDETTGSWWRQATGEAVCGPLKGEMLPELPSTQMTLRQWFALNPNGMVMQFDPVFRSVYDSTGRFEKGKSRSHLTRTDTLSWQDKSWVVGILLNGESKAYDWRLLQEKRIINDQVGNQPIVLALAPDDQSFVVFERPGPAESFTLKGDTLITAVHTYDFSGRNLNTLRERLPGVNAYQEFWHSWRTFHPDTKKYE